MDAYLLKYKDTDSGFLEIDKIVYIPNYFAMIYKMTNRKKQGHFNCWSVANHFGLRGRNDLPKGLDFFNHIIRNNNVEGGYNDFIEYISKLNLPILESNLIDAMEDTNLFDYNVSNINENSLSSKIEELISIIKPVLDSADINNKVYSADEWLELHTTDLEFSYSDFY